MNGTRRQPAPGSVWRLAERQHGVVSRTQLLALGFSRHAIQHRLEIGRLHPLWRGVYAVGRPQVAERGRFAAAVLACGAGALLSHRSAAALWGIHRSRASAIDVAVAKSGGRKLPGIRVHRQRDLGPDEHRRVDGIPVTDPVWTLVDLAGCIGTEQLERAINEADRLDLVDPERLRLRLDSSPRRPGLGRLRTLLDKRTFTRTDSPLEREFLPLARDAGLPSPQTQVVVNGFRVDFFWPGLGLVVETDGLRYHRTPSQQTVDRRRDQAHAAAGFTTLRFSTAQIRFEPGHVRSTLTAVAARLAIR